MQYGIIIDGLSQRIENSGYKEKSFKIFEEDGMEFLFEHSCKYFFTKKVPTNPKSNSYGMPDYYIEVFVTWGQCSSPSKGDYEFVTPIRIKRISPSFYKEDEIKDFCRKCFFNSFESIGGSYENLEEFIGKLEMGNKEYGEQSWCIMNSDVGIIFSGNFSKFSGAFSIQILDRGKYFDRFLKYLARGNYKISRVSGDLESRCSALNIVPTE